MSLIKIGNTGKGGCMRGEWQQVQFGHVASEVIIGHIGREMFSRQLEIQDRGSGEGLGL